MTPALPPDPQQAPFSKQEAASRLRFLDGLRGIAALVVFFWHFANTFYPLVNKGFMTAWIMQTPIWLAYNGAYAVMIFFVLSGFVLSLSTTNSKARLPALVISRYFRLTIPILVSLILAWFLLECFSDVRVQLRQISPSPWLRIEFFGAHIPSFFVTVKDAFYQTYYKGQNLFNNVLWTMQIELVGSIGIYLLYKLVPEAYRWYGLAAFGLSFFVWPWYLGFPIGAAIQECWRRNKFHPNAWFWPLLILGLACTMSSQITTLSSPTYGFLLALGAGLVVLSIFHLPAASRFLCSPFPQFLGRISFCLYLVHVPLLISIGAWLYFHLAGGNELRIAVLLPIMLIISFCVAWIMTVTVDEPLLRKLRQFKRNRS